MLEPCSLEALQDSAACCLPPPLLALVRGYARPRILLIRLPPPAPRFEISAAVWEAWALLIKHFIGPFVENYRPAYLNTLKIVFECLQPILLAWNESAIMRPDSYPDRWSDIPALSCLNAAVGQLEYALLAIVPIELAACDIRARKEWLRILQMLAVRSSNTFKFRLAQALKKITAIPVGGEVRPAHVEALRKIQAILAREDAPEETPNVRL